MLQNQFSQKRSRISSKLRHSKWIHRIMRTKHQNKQAILQIRSENFAQFLRM